MRVPDAMSSVEWPAGWVDGSIAGIDVMTLKLDAGGTATLLTACLSTGTCLAVLDAPGAQRLGRMRVVLGPTGPMGGEFETVDRGRAFTAPDDRPLTEAWDAVSRSYKAARNAVEAEWPALPREDGTA